jgi:hypothetical protein
MQTRATTAALLERILSPMTGVMRELAEVLGDRVEAPERDEVVAPDAVSPTRASPPGLSATPGAVHRDAPRVRAEGPEIRGADRPDPVAGPESQTVLGGAAPERPAGVSVPRPAHGAPAVASPVTQASPPALPATLGTARDDSPQERVDARRVPAEGPELRDRLDQGAGPESETVLGGAPASRGSGEHAAHPRMRLRPVAGPTRRGRLEFLPVEPPIAPSRDAAQPAVAAAGARVPDPPAEQGPAEAPSRMTGVEARSAPRRSGLRPSARLSDGPDDAADPRMAPDRVSPAPRPATGVAPHTEDTRGSAQGSAPATTDPQDPRIDGAQGPAGGLAGEARSAQTRLPPAPAQTPSPDAAAPPGNASLAPPAPAPAPAPAALTPEALEDAILRILRDAARRHGLEV